MRSRLLLAAVTGMALVSTWRGAVRAPERAPEIGVAAERFSAVAGLVPPHEVVGYVSDRPVDTPVPAPPYAVRYIFAPRLLVWGSERVRWVVVDSATAPAGLRLVRDFGGGVALYRRP